MPAHEVYPPRCPEIMCLWSIILLFVLEIVVGVCSIVVYGFVLYLSEF